MFGPICTGIFLFLALWGIAFMAILGGLFYNESVGLFEDLPGEGAFENKTWEERKAHFTSMYHQNAYNCWIACAAYIVVSVLLLLRCCCLARR